VNLAAQIASIDLNPMVYSLRGCVLALARIILKGK
jgi:hypothetical protein